jgi:hypothetical protein
LGVVGLEGIEVSQTDEEIIVARDLTDDTVELGDVLSLADEHDVELENVVTSMPDSETRLRFGRPA